MSKKNKNEVELDADTNGVEDTSVVDVNGSSAKRAEKTAKKNGLYESLKALIADNSEATLILQSLRPSLYGLSNTGRGTVSKHTIFGDMFEEVGDIVDELKLFKALKIGTLEGKKLCRKLIAKSLPEVRKWVHYDAINCEYTLVGIGEAAPDNWSGYRPTEDELLTPVENSDF